MFWELDWVDFALHWTEVSTISDLFEMFDEEDDARAECRSMFSFKLFGVWLFESSLFSDCSLLSLLADEEVSAERTKNRLFLFDITLNPGVVLVVAFEKYLRLLALVDRELTSGFGVTRLLLLLVSWLCALFWSCWITNEDREVEISCFDGCCCCCFRPVLLLASVLELFKFSEFAL